MTSHIPSSFAGCCFQSLFSSPDDYFYGAVIFVAEHNNRGAVGFVLNRPHPRRLNELTAFVHLPPFFLYEGGPVDEDHLYFIHRRPDLISGGAEVADGVYFGGDFREATEAMAAGILKQSDIQLFIGYCGWDQEELEEEIKEQGWSATEHTLFS